MRLIIELGVTITIDQGLRPRMKIYKQSVSKTPTNTRLIRFPSDDTQLAKPPELKSTTKKYTIQAAINPVSTLISGDILRFFSKSNFA